MFFWGICYVVLSFDKHNCEPNIKKYVENIHADIVQVHLLHRHGARTPLHIAENVKNRWECTNTEMSSHNNNISKSLHIHVAYGRSVFLGNCHFGQLLGKGVTALNKLGRYIRDIYVDKLKFLPTNFDSRFFYFRSTYTIRTLHSMMSVFNGMYPSGDEIVIETAEKAYDPWRRTSQVCPNLVNKMKTLQKSKEWKDAGLDEPNFTSKMKEKFGIKWSSVNDAGTSTLCQGFKLPEGVTIADVDHAIKLKAAQHQFTFNHDEVFPLFFGFQAADIVNKMEERISGTSAVRFVHWSAHDGNINSFLGYLGIQDGRWPPYGSFFLIELLKNRETEELFIQIRLNGEVIAMPRFGSRTEVPYKEFSQFVRDNLPVLEKTCGFDTKAFLETDVLPSPLS